MLGGAHLDKYETLKILAMKQYYAGKIDKVTFNAKLATINEQEEREKNENKTNR